jgi:ATP-dependent RNA helicase RhlB
LGKIHAKLVSSIIMSKTHLSDIAFSDFNLPDSLMQGIHDSGFEQCTPIQATTLPLTLAGQDIAGQAQTGTGKTAAFLIAMMARLLNNPSDPQRRPNQPRGFILAPTRELAIQIHQDAVALGRHTGLALGVVYGGAGYESQGLMLGEGVDILIATPGRVIDYFKQKLFDLMAVEVVVMDEADRMFDLGFIKDIRYLFRRMPSPEQRLTLLFSATLSARVTELAYEHMNNAKLIRITPEKITADNVRQSIYYTSNEEKIPLLIGLLQKMNPERTIIFVNTKGAGRRVCAWLQGNDFNAEALSGDVAQNKRMKLLLDFQQGQLPILVATDVAARGLHIPDVSHVINYDLPQDAEDYIHRIGRTARAGASGDAISFACEEYAFSLPDIEQQLGHKIESLAVTTELLAKPKPPVREERPATPHKHKNTSRPRHHGNTRQRPAR